ncbi:Hydrogenase expression/formation protein HoxQ [Methylocaldum szegediense]|uniref:Hydrogenase expression/formation protein HoxQ n=2 Tax=Methylocaldum szegediense TaxID=73780 RepID=A0ABN8X262_9GAMM|nr:Hydrogenase expression/formation protein HoxQ [Methylocaldum szegediense]
MTMLEQHSPVATENARPVSPFDDPECGYLQMPRGMQTFSMPITGGIPASRAGIAVLRQLAECLTAELNGIDSDRIDLDSYDEETGRFLDQVLGDGEVSALVDIPDVRWAIRESVFIGVWRLREFRPGEPARDYLEVGSVPAVLRQAGRYTSGVERPQSFPEGLMNAPSLLVEVFAKSAAFEEGQSEVINLSLLPMTENDLAYLVDVLGLAGVSILSKGYGDCRIRLTGLPNVWWVQYFNASDQMILNTLEITPIPQAAQATREDLEDSLQRIRELLALLKAS